MRHCRADFPNRCCHLISRVNRRAVEGVQAANRRNLGSVPKFSDFDIKGGPGLTSRSFSGEIITIGVRFIEICLQCGWQTFYHKGVYDGK